MALGAVGLVAQRAAWLGVALACGACGGRSSSSSSPSEGPSPTRGGETGAGAPRSEGAAGVDASSAGGDTGPAIGPIARGGSPSQPEDKGESAGGSGDEPPVEATCAELAGPLRAELLWQDVYRFYGSSDYPFMGFAPDGAELVVPIDEGAYSEGNRSYAVRGGDVSVHPLPAILDRDAAWSRQVLAQKTVG